MQENLLEALKMDSRICVLADASRWKRLRVPMDSLLRGQIEGCDIVLINKTDLVPEDALDSIETEIHEIEPKAPVMRISAIKGVANEVWSAIAGG